MSILSFLAESTMKIDPSKIGIGDPVRSGDSILLNVLNTAYFWAGIVCVIIIIAGGFFYVTSNGNAANIKRGKDAIMGAIIGLVVILLAFTITQFVLGRFQ
jgi:hypothetical protein